MLKIFMLGFLFVFVLLVGFVVLVFKGEDPQIRYC